MDQNIQKSNSQSLQKSKPVTSRIKTDESGNTTISIYKGNQLNDYTYKAGKDLLKTRFTNFDEAMSMILLDRLKEHGFTNQRFMDAVKYVIDNHKYPTMTPADILQFDKVLNLRTWHQVSKEEKEFGHTIWQYYKPVEIKGICYYVHTTELANYNITLPEYKPKPATDKTNITGEYKDGKRVIKEKSFNMVDAMDKLETEWQNSEKAQEIEKWHKEAQNSYGISSIRYEFARNKLKELGALIKYKLGL